MKYGKVAMEAMGAIFGLVAAAVVSNCNEGCKPVQSPTDDEYKAAQVQCVLDAKTLEESKACRKRVDAQFHVCEGEWPTLRPCQ